jgi:hypothetical protein
MCPAAEDIAEVAPGDFNCNKSAHTAHRYWEEIGLQNLAKQAENSKSWRYLS